MSLHLCAENVKCMDSHLHCPAPRLSGVEFAESKGACNDIVALVSVAGAKKELVGTSGCYRQCSKADNDST